MAGQNASTAYAQRIHPPVNRWVAEVAIKDLIEAVEVDEYDYVSDDTVRALASGIAIRLGALRSLGYASDDGLWAIIDQLECIATAPNGEWAEDYTLRQDFDDRLTELYDWADERRVIIASDPLRSRPASSSSETQA